MPGSDLQSKEQLCEGTQVVSYFPISSSLNYESSKAGNYFKYFDCFGSEPAIRVLKFQGFGVSMQLSLMIARCCWQAKNNTSLQSAIDKDERLSEEYNYPLQQEEEVARLAAGLEDLRVDETRLVKEEFKALQSESEERYRDFRGISQLRRLDISMITNGPVVQVYGQHNDQFKKITTFKELRDRQGRRIVPSRMLPLKGESRAFVLDPERPADGYYVDINKETVLAEFTRITKEDIVAISHRHKADQQEEVEVFYGITQQGVYMFDPRTESCVGFKKQYKTRTGFSALGSTGDGSFAVGSASGQVRLYKEPGQQAKNNYQSGEGDPVQHLECTADGGLVLATFDSYLLLIPSCSEDMGDAFREKIPRARRMAPRRLRLKPEDYSRVRKDSRFTKARFSQEEQLITAGLGELMVIWELLEVLKGNIYGYRLLDAEDHLRECQFLLSDPKKLIVVSDSRVRLQRFAK